MNKFVTVAFLTMLTGCATLKNEMQQMSGKPITAEYALSFASIEQFIKTALDNTTKIDGNTIPLTPPREDGRIWKSYYAPKSKDPQNDIEKPSKDLAVYCASHGGQITHSFLPKHKEMYNKSLSGVESQSTAFGYQYYEYQNMVSYVFNHNTIGVFDCTNSQDTSKSWKVLIDTAGFIRGDMNDAFRLHSVFFRIKRI